LTPTRNSVFEVLTAYIRQHALRDLEARGPNTGVNYLGMRAPDVQAAITVLGRRTAMATDPPLDLSDTDLSVGSFVHARLQRVNFIGALLPATDFTGAQLQNASMPGVLLWNADFTNAQLQGANLGDAKVRNPDFMERDATRRRSCRRGTNARQLGRSSHRGHAIGALHR
jgi:Pentapeptide repeats (8 copies)